MYEDLKKRIKEIIDIVESIPEKFQEQCFEVLLNAALKNAASPPAIQNGDSLKLLPEFGDKSSEEANSFKIPARVRTFLSRSSINETTLRGLVFVEEGQVLFVQEPDTQKISKGQINWALLLALKSAISGNEFQVDPEDVRSVCIEKGLYDRANFTKNFKTNKALFNKVPTTQGGSVRLSQDGEKRLAELIKELMSKVQQ